MLVPPNVTSFYSNELDQNTLFQGDIIDACGIGFKNEENDNLPDYWIIISKNCDLVLTNNIPRKQNISVLPIFTLKLLSKIYGQEVSNILSGLRKKIVLLAIRKISTSFPNIGKSKIGNIINDKVSKYMYLPPDGNVLTEPMIIDFDLVRPVDASKPDLVEKFLKSKALELVSPFREKMAQRFANHFISIGIDDDYIKQKTYIEEACKSCKE